MFYEKMQPLSIDDYKIFNNSNLSAPMHIHSCYEFIMVTDGEMLITVGNQTKLLKKNDCAIIFPNQTHSMETPEQSKDILCLFSRDLINYFHQKFKNRIPACPFFHLNDIPAKAFENIEDCDTITLKGVLYLVCGDFNKSAEYVNIDTKSKHSLLHHLLAYIEDNYDQRCTLSDISKQMTYDYYYLSKFFAKQTGFSFNRYVNMRRVSNACHLLSTTDMNVIEISNLCGYGSLRSLNRNFKEITGISPSEFRNSKEKTKNIFY